MVYLIRVLMFLEVLFINLLTSHRCLKKRYSVKKIIGEMTLFTAVLFVVSFLIKLKFKSTYVNNTVMILLGFTYFFPLKHLYDESSDRIFAIMLFSWIHTMTVASISAQISSMFGFGRYFYITLMIQTAVFLFSTPLIIIFIKTKFVYVLKNISKEMNYYLIVLSLVEFAIISIINLYFIQNTNSNWKIIVIVLAALTAAISYNLIYIIVKNFGSINFLKQLAYSDTLTGVKNRVALFFDCEKIISENKPFALIYMDLDDFKKINDTYGHSVGDDYLKQFTEATVETIGNHGNIYRMSGDEFICIYMDEKIEMFLEKIDEKILNLFEMSIPFLGVSIGYAKFPEDADSLDDLIKKADRKMYKVKKTAKKEKTGLK